MEVVCLVGPILVVGPILAEDKPLDWALHAPEEEVLFMQLVMPVALPSSSTRPRANLRVIGRWCGSCPYTVHGACAAR